MKNTAPSNERLVRNIAKLLVKKTIPATVKIVSYGMPWDSHSI